MVAAAGARRRPPSSQDRRRSGVEPGYLVAGRRLCRSLRRRTRNPGASGLSRGERGHPAGELGNRQPPPAAVCGVPAAGPVALVVLIRRAGRCRSRHRVIGPRGRAPGRRRRRVPPTVSDHPGRSGPAWRLAVRHGSQRHRSAIWAVRRTAHAGLTGLAGLAEVGGLVGLVRRLPDG